MTPTQILTEVRLQYNAVGDNYFSDSELLNLLYQACLELAKESECIQKRYSTTTVADQREYQIPTYCYRIQRVTWKGKRLDQIDFTEDDFETGNDETSTVSGTPKYFSQWGGTLFLRPIPDSAEALKIYSVSFPEVITTTSTLDIPEVYHPLTIDYILSAMFAKDSNYSLAKYHRDLWRASVDRSKGAEMRRRIGDSYPMVKDIDQMPRHGGYDY